MEDIMQAKDLMSLNPCCCTADSTVREAARMMVEHDCGEIPVVDSSGCPIGVITDRDICCRLVAQGIETNNARVSEFMTSPAITIRESASSDDCRETMERNMIRRVPVVDESGKCTGIVSQADIAQKSDSYSVSHLIKEVSAPRPNPIKSAGV
jgi:CBS domain-containing protein